MSSGTELEAGVGEVLIERDALQERVNDVLQNNFSDQPEQGTVDVCAKIIRRYPKSMAAAYCQSYVSITKFKLLFEKKSSTSLT